MKLVSVVATVAGLHCIFSLAGEPPAQPTVSPPSPQVEKAEAEFKASVNAARKVLVTKLTAELQVLTKKGDLDGAVKLRDLIKSYEAPVAETKLDAKPGELLDLSKTATYKTSSNWLKPLPNLLNGVGGGYGSSGQKGTDFAFHTNEENNPFIIIDLSRVCVVSKLIITNRSDAGREEQAATLTMYVSQTATGPWQEVWKAENVQLEWTVDTAQTTRFIKLGLREKAYFHLHSVKILGK